MQQAVLAQRPAEHVYGRRGQRGSQGRPLVSITQHEASEPPIVRRMAVPPFHHYLDPVLQAAADGERHNLGGLADASERTLGLTSDDVRILIPSGKRSRHRDRVSWAVTYMAQAALLERTSRGFVRITPRGLDLLATGPRPITLSALERFPEYRQFKDRRGTGRGHAQTAAADEAAEASSPLEAMASLADSANEAVAADLLARVIAQPPIFLERLVLQLLAALGYGGLDNMTEHLGGPGDGGLDGVIQQDALGLDVVYVQAKRYAPDRKISRPGIQEFVGALSGAQADRGVFITTSAFTPDAVNYAERVGMRLVLIDGRKLAHLMVERNVGVSIEETYHLKRIDEDYFD